jgi:hypothetical protein
MVDHNGSRERKIEVAAPENQKLLWQEGQQLLSKVASIAALRSEGAALFKQKKYAEAVDTYDKAPNKQRMHPPPRCAVCSKQFLVRTL